MKLLVIVTVLITSVLIFLSSCTTVNESSPVRQGNSATSSNRSSTADPYYQSNPDGSYYQRSEEGDNADFNAGVKRFGSFR